MVNVVQLDLQQKGVPHLLWFPIKTKSFENHSRHQIQTIFNFHYQGIFTFSKWIIFLSEHTQCVPEIIKQNQTQLLQITGKILQRTKLSFSKSPNTILQINQIGKLRSKPLIFLSCKTVSGIWCKQSAFPLKISTTGKSCLECI